MARVWQSGWEERRSLRANLRGKPLINIPHLNNSHDVNFTRGAPTNQTHQLTAHGWAAEFWGMTKVSPMHPQHCTQVLLSHVEVDMVLYCSKPSCSPWCSLLRRREGLAAAASVALVMTPIDRIFAATASPEV